MAHVERLETAVIERTLERARTVVKLELSEVELRRITEDTIGACLSSRRFSYAAQIAESHHVRHRIPDRPGGEQIPLERRIPPIAEPSQLPALERRQTSGGGLG